MGTLILGLTVATVVVLLLGGSTLAFLRHRKERLAAVLPMGASVEPTQLPPQLRTEWRPVKFDGGQPGITRVAELTLRQAEDLLDWLEQKGCTDRNLACEQDKFTVTYRLSTE